MQLDKRVDVVASGGGNASRIEAALVHRFRQLGIDAIDRTDDRARAPEVGVEAGALFLADRDHFQRAPRRALRFQQRLDGRQPRHDAERAVEPPALAHRVDV